MKEHLTTISPISQANATPTILFEANNYLSIEKKAPKQLE